MNSGNASALSGEHAGAVFMAAVMVVSMVAAGAAGAAGAAVDDGEIEQEVETTEEPEIAYVFVNGTSDDRLEILFEDNSSESFEGSNSIEALGPVVEFDGHEHVPYVDDSGDLYTYNVTGDNEETILATDAFQGPTHLGVGEQDGEAVIYYVEDADNNEIKAVNAAGDEEVVHEESAVAVLGDYDFTGDGDDELVYVGEPSDEIRYVDSDADPETQSTSTERSVDDDSGIGVGAPADVFGNDTMYVPYVDSDDLYVTDSDGNSQSITSGGDEEKVPVAAADIYDDPTYQFLVMQGSTVHIADVDGNTETAPEPHTARQKPGIVAGTASPNLDSPEIRIDEVHNETVTADDDLNVTVEVTEAPQVLDTITVDAQDLGSTQINAADGEGFYDLTVDVEDSTEDDYDITATVIDEFDVEDTDAEPDAVTYESPVSLDELTVSDIDVETGDPIDFSVDVDGDTETPTEWDFDDGTTATGESVSHSYDDDGTYDATVTVTDEAGNEIEETVSVEVSSPSAGGGGGFDSNVAERDSAAIEDGELTIPGSDVATIDFEEHASGTVVVDRLHEVPNEVDEDATLEDDVVEVYDIDAPDQPATIELELDGVEADDDVVVVQHWDGDEWEALDTEAERDDGTLTVEAETPGFSVFAVTESDADGTDDGADDVDDETEESDETDDTEDADTEDDDGDADTEDGDTGDGDTVDGDTVDGDTEEADVAGTEADAAADEPADEETEDELPGFGAVVALVALLAAALVATRRRS